MYQDQGNQGRIHNNLRRCFDLTTVCLKFLTDVKKHCDSLISRDFDKVFVGGVVVSEFLNEEPSTWF